MWRIDLLCSLYERGFGGLAVSLDDYPEGIYTGTQRIESPELVFTVIYFDCFSMDGVWK